jgi:hypothetical protein
MPKIIKPAGGTFTTADITVDSSGRIIAASTGTAGGNNMKPALWSVGPNSGTFTSNASKILIYAASAGGGGGGRSSVTDGRNGGMGFIGVFSDSITAPFTAPYSIGASGTGATGNTAGNAGGNTVFGNILTISGGNGGQRGSPNPSQTQEGNIGAVTTGTADITGTADNDSYREMFMFGTAGVQYYPGTQSYYRGVSVGGKGDPGETTGGPGALLVYTDSL